MTASRCGIHGAPTHGAVLCHHCCTEISKALGDVAALAEDLDITLSRQDQFDRPTPRPDGTSERRECLACGGEGFRVGLASHHPRRRCTACRGTGVAPESLHVGRAVFDVTASTTAGELHATLLGWARDVRGDTPDPVGPVHPVCAHPSCDWLRRSTWAANTSTAISRWLLGQMDAIRQHPQGAQMHDEISYAVGQARRAVDRPKNRSRVFVGPCLEDCCVGELWAAFPLAEFDPNDPTTHATISCTECDATYPADQWLRVGTRLLQRRAS